MSFRSCTNCGETADLAKAFCPGCGNPFVAEQRRNGNSEFEVSGNTIQFSKTAFNMVLSDMGLNISETPDRPGKTMTKIPVQPVAQNHEQPIQKSPRVKWIVIGAAAAVLLFFAVLIVAGGVGFYFYTKPT